MKLLTLFLVCSSLSQAAETYVIDPSASHIEFNGSSTLHDFAGAAKIKNGLITLDGATSTGVVESDATTLDTDNSSRDKKLHGEIMATKTYPVVRFDLQNFTTTPTGGVATGWWSMHGVTRSISFPVTITPTGTAAPKHAIAKFVLDIREWDIPVPRAALIITVDPAITVNVDLTMNPGTKPAATPQPHMRSCGGIALVTSALAPVDFNKIAPGHPIVLFDYDGVSDGKEWVTALSAKLPPTQAPIAVLLANGLADKYRAKALKSAPANTLVDMTGSFAAQLHVPKREAMVLTVNAAGVASDVYTGEPDEAGRDVILKSLGITVK